MAVKISGSTLTPQSISSVPSAVTVFNHEQIAAMGVDSVDELLPYVPGFQSYRSHDNPNQKAFSVRGRRIGFIIAEVLVLVDGQRLSEPNNSGSGRLLPKLSVDNIERVEFIRGPGSAIYGANALSGVINIISRKNVNEVGIAYGSFNRRIAKMFLSHSEGDVNVDLFARHETDDGDDYSLYEPDIAAEVPSTDPQAFSEINAKMQWQDSQLGLLYQKNEGDNFYEFGRVANGYNNNVVEFLAANFKQSFSSESEALNGYFWLGYRQSDRTFRGRLAPEGTFVGASSPSSSAPLLADGGFTNTKEFQYLTHIDWSISDHQSWQSGVEYRRTDIPNQYADSNYDIAALAQGNFPIDYYGDTFQPTLIESASVRKIYGLYSQYQHRLGELTDLTLGARYDKFSKIGDNVSPRLAVVQQLSSQHTLKLLYGEAYRAPNEFELNLINNPQVIGNPDLQPETVKSYDFIWLWQSPNMHFSAGYFVNTFEDSIVEVNLVGGGKQSINISGSETSRGVELEFYFQLNEDWLLQSSFAHLTENSDQMFREADNFGSLMLNYQQPNWDVNLSAVYNGEREMQSPSGMLSLDDYWLLFAKTSYQITPQLRTYLQAKNLLGKQYRSPTDGADSPIGVPNRDRELLLGLNWAF